MENQNTWLAPIGELKGVGPKTVPLFQRLGIFTVRDLFFHFPFRFEDMQARDLASVLDGEKVALVGTVSTPPIVNYYGYKKSRLSFRLSIDRHNVIGVNFFNQPYLKNTVELGNKMAVYGKWQENQQSLLGIKIIQQDMKDTDDYAPIYRTTQGLKQNRIVNAIRQAFTDYKSSISELIPAYFNDKFHLVPLHEALFNMHFPKSKKELTQAQRKVIFLEFFIYQWRLQNALKNRQQQQGMRVLYEVDDLRKAIEHIPFELTQAQKMAVNEICRDLMAPYPMKRLLQGDVGSGKTLVAFITMIATVQAGFQTALMVPTEILAKQHHISFNQTFEAIGIRAELLTSEMPAKEKQDIIQGIKTGRIRLVIGTHALIQEAIEFNRLAYAVIDEQHRFGVNQRQTLLEKGPADYIPNLLQMTATPIPRSLAQTLYADMHVSTIDELPKGRKEITTYAIQDSELNIVYQAIEAELRKGHQAYYVLPLIEASEHMEQVENVNNIAQRLESIFPFVSIGVLHGQLNKEEQNGVMAAFKENKVQILVATTMVEVGVDVPNATIMVIQSAERFGLAQLHQLRGRVGRSEFASYCYLIANPTTEQGEERIAKMVESQDGFELSAADLKIRGMGDMLGKNQSGLPQFKFANPIEDQAVMEAAYLAVQELMVNGHLISDKELDLLKDFINDQGLEV